MNHILIDSHLTRAELAMPLCQSDKLDMVPNRLIYGLNTTMFESRQELSALIMGEDACGVLTGLSQNGTGHRIPCDKPSHWRSFWALLRDVSAH